jgi:K+-sensing histidine kinase KdpD
MSPQPPDDDRSTSQEERRGGYLGYVAHEVRNPLSTALWSAELLARMSPEDRGGARGEKLAGMCLRSLGRVRQLVEDHFLCERLDAHGIAIRPELLTVREILEGVASRHTLDIGPVAVEVSPSLLVLADRALLERALDALLAAAGREGVAVRVTSREEGSRALIAIAGRPLAPQPLEDPRKGSPGDPKGRSLALPLARRAAAALGGTLAVEGEAFVLSLPRAGAYTASPDPSAHP